MRMWRRRGWTIAAVVIVAACVAAVGAGEPAREGRTVEHGRGSYVDIDASRLAEMLDRKDFTLINVHIPYEGDIAGTDLSVPFDRIAEHLHRLPQDRSARIVLYCRTGHMSTAAARELVDRGYTNLWHLAGGMVGWARAGYPIVRTDR